MKLNLFGRACRLAVIGAILLCSASCIYVDESLGENLIPTDQKWDVFTPESAVLENIQLHNSDSLSAYSSTRFTFGAISDPLFGTSIQSTSFTLVPILDSISFGENTRIRQFHFNAIRDTLSSYNDTQSRILQNVYVSELKVPLDTLALYTGTFMSQQNRDKYLNTDKLISAGVPVYAGGDTLSFDFSKEFTESVIKKLDKQKIDSLEAYTEKIPGIFMTTDTPISEGGRINMFELSVKLEDGFILGNYAELKFTADYGERKDVDTSFIFIFGPGKMIDEESTTFPTQFAFNTSDNQTKESFIEDWKAGNKENLYIEGGSGVKPVITAKEIREIVLGMMYEAGITDTREAVINKATIILPYDMPADYKAMDHYPTVLSPTVRLQSENGGYITYAGLTDSSISSEDQGDINRSVCMYSPDISHHVQEIIKLDENSEDFEKNICKYDIWMLIMHDEIVQSSSSSNSSMNDLYNSLLYSSYYNNMMYGGGYGGYGYGYGGYGYGGYGGYGYGYNNYYNYMMMAAMSSSYSTSETTSRSLDKDRFYKAILNGPGNPGEKPRIRVTFSAPKTAE